MEFRIPRRAVADIESHALAAYPEECCGFLIGEEHEDSRTVSETRPAKNVHPEMRHVRYTIDPRDVLAVDRELRGTPSRVLGFYHSHPDNPPVPSDYDAACAWPWYVYAILSVARGSSGEFRTWRYDDDAKAFRETPVRIG